MAFQRAYFPMKVIAISQGYGSKSSTHKYSYALDLAGKDTGKDEIFAPFDCKVTKLYQPRTKNGAIDKTHSPEVWLTSTKKVLCANGYYGYLTISLTHSPEVYKMKIGQVYKQFQKIMTEDHQGIGNGGNHIHLELSKGTKAGWKIIKGNYVNVNGVKPEEYLFVKEDSTIKNATYKGTTYKLIKESDITYKVANVPSEPLYIHKSADYKDGSLLDKKGLKNGDEVIKFKNVGNMSLIYNYGRLGYTASKYLKK